MPVRILFFGQLTDITGTDETIVEQVSDTDELIGILENNFPALSKSTYRIAINQQLATGNSSIQPNSTVALMPPFSGG